MAVIYRCDKCTKESTSHDFLKEIKIPQIDNLPWDKVYTICDTCIRQVHEALKPGTYVTFPTMGQTK